MNSDRLPDEPIPLAILERVDQKCLQFEAAWRAGQQPRIESFVAETSGVERTKALRELLLLDLDYRLRSADTPTAAEYERRFPDDASLIEAVFRKIATEAGGATLVGAESTGAIALHAHAAGDPSRYQVLRHHAQGGLGEVFIAHDQHLNREVALKELQARHADDENMRARFAREAEITGALEHPGIVPVHSLGTYEDGRLFYTMRFIDGVRLTDSVRDQHASAAGRTSAARSIEFRKLLVRFIDVCHTIEYAHSRGVLHRDLKPENIMLGRYGETFIVDWGLAKTQTDVDGAGGCESLMATDLRLSCSDVAETRVGSAIGTPAFMSPEQAAGQRDRIGRWTDVYGLGATLYFILTGTPPFSADDKAAILSRVREGQFPLPRHVKPDIPRALQAICLKAMAADPDNRYASARALSEDVEAWLADEPTTAYREPLRERSRRFVRRHHTPIGITVAFMLVLFAGLGVGMAVLGAKNRELHATNEREAAALEESQRRFQLALEAIQCYYTDVSEDVVLREPRLTGLRDRMLKVSLAFYEQLQQELQGDEDPASRAALADAYAAVASIARQIRDFDQAVASSEKEIAIRESLAKESPVSEQVLLDLVDSHNGLGGVHMAAGNRGLAAAAFRHAWEVANRLAASSPHSALPQSALAQCCNNLATVSAPDIARDYLRQAIHIHEKLVTQYPESSSYQAHLARHCGNLSRFLAEAGQCEEAALLFVRAITIADRLVTKYPDVTKYREDLSSYHYNMADVQRLLGNLEQAITYLQRALSIDQQLAGDYANVTLYQWSLLKRYNNLGPLLFESGRLIEAGQAYDKAIAVGKILVANDPSTADYAIVLGGAYCNSGNLAFRQGSIEEAMDDYSQAVVVLEPLLDRDNRSGNARQFLANSYAARARALGVRQRYAEAVDDWDRSIELNPSGQDGKLDQRLVQRARMCALSGDHARCVREAEQLASAGEDPAAEFEAACLLGIAAEMAVQDESLAAPQRQLLASQYADQAIERLLRARRGGYFDNAGRIQQLTAASDLRALHSHPGFGQFLEQLQQR